MIIVWIIELWLKLCPVRSQWCWPLTLSHQILSGSFRSQSGHVCKILINSLTLFSQEWDKWTTWMHGAVWLNPISNFYSYPLFLCVPCPLRTDLTDVVAEISPYRWYNCLRPSYIINCRRQRPSKQTWSYWGVMCHQMGKCNTEIRQNAGLLSTNQQ